MTDQENPDKIYGAHKVSQYSTPKGRYRVDESDGVPARQSTRSELFDQLEKDSEIDYKKRFSKADGGMEAEYKSARDVLGDFSPFQWRKQLNFIRDNYTPEEYETVLDWLYVMKLNCKKYSIYFSAFTLSFVYWQRMFLPRWFFLPASLFGVFMGTTYGIISSSRIIIENLDKLGKEYQLSRMVK